MKIKYLITSFLFLTIISAFGQTNNTPAPSKPDPKQAQNLAAPNKPADPKQANQNLPKDTPKHYYAAKAPFTLAAILYSNLTSSQDNDPSGFTQTYLGITIPGKGKDSGVMVDSTSTNDLIILRRNTYIQLLYNGSSNNNFVDNISSSGTHANELDMLQYAYINAKVYYNIITFVRRKQTKEYYHAYGDILLGGLLTKDTIKNVTNNIVPSAIYGIHIGVKTESGISSDWIFEGGLSLFHLSTITNDFDADLSPQYSKIYDTSFTQNKNNKSLLYNKNHIFANFEGTATYTTTIGGKVTAQEFFRVSIYSNLLTPKSAYSNFYIQLQLGTSVLISDLFPTKKATTTPK